MARNRFLVAKLLQPAADFTYKAGGTAYRPKPFYERPVYSGRCVESAMKTKQQWRQHLVDLVSTHCDPIVYAMQWAQDPRCAQRGVSHRRVGAFATVPVCRLWAGNKVR
jgi:hypothetical protein